MRENRPYGSEGGEAPSLPYPYQRTKGAHVLLNRRVASLLAMTARKARDTAPRMR
jgi:hypothetical protein